jgi:hypothetical protein
MMGCFSVHAEVLEAFWTFSHTTCYYSPLSDVKKKNARWSKADGLINTIDKHDCAGRLDCGSETSLVEIWLQPNDWRRHYALSKCARSQHQL